MAKMLLPRNRIAGFTLVELAIVMIIIGLLIAGVLKSIEMVGNARMTATIAQIKSYQAAHQTFVDMYNAMPGDMANATTRLPGCTGAANCYNGDGNGVVGIVSTNYSHDNQAGTLAAGKIETSMYWKHLADADLITGVDPGADPASPAWGETHPTARYGGGFAVLTADEPDGPPNNPAHGLYYMLRLKPGGDPHPLTSGIEVMSARQALRIDTKMDDGLSISGVVRADDAGTKCSDVNTGIYSAVDLHDCLTIYLVR